MPPSITSRALHLAMRAPGDLTVRQALRWGQVKSLGGCPGIMDEVLSSRMVRDLSNDGIWSRLLSKVIQAGSFHAGHFGLIADTLIEVMEWEDCDRAHELVTLPLDHLLRYCRRYWQALLKLIRNAMPESGRDDIHCPRLREELHRMNANQWTRLPRTKPFERIREEAGRSFRCRIVELTHQWQLVAESQAMRHCIDTYGLPWRAGMSSVFSVRVEETTEEKTGEESHLTIHVERRSRRIVEVRGRRNRPVRVAEIPMLRTWAAEMELTF
jgi:hypothetical protein